MPTKVLPNRSPVVLVLAIGLLSLLPISAPSHDKDAPSVDQQASLPATAGQAQPTAVIADGPPPRTEKMIFFVADGMRPDLVHTYNATYTLATNDFMALGSDGYPNFAGRFTTRDLMDAVLTAHITANSPVSPALQARIACTTSGSLTCPVVTP